MTRSPKAQPRRYSKRVEKALARGLEAADAAETRIRDNRDEQQDTLADALDAAGSITLNMQLDGQEQRDSALTVRDGLEDAADVASMLADFYRRLEKDLNLAAQKLDRALNPKRRK